MYWIDPNRGSPADAVLVYCDMKAKATCITAKPGEVNFRWQDYFSMSLSHEVKLIWYRDVPILTESITLSIFGLVIWDQALLKLLKGYQRNVVSWKCKESLVWRSHCKWFPGKSAESSFESLFFIIVENCRSGGKLKMHYHEVFYNSYWVQLNRSMLLFYLIHVIWQLYYQVIAICKWMMYASTTCLSGILTVAMFRCCQTGAESSTCKIQVS